MLRFRLVYLLIGLLLSVQGFADTIYVDKSNVADLGQDGSAAHPWGTLTNAVADLVTQNGISQGGHIIAVAQGIYTGQVTLGADCAGLEGLTNCIIGTNAILTGTDGTSGTGFYVNNCHHTKIEGFDVRHFGQGFYYGGSRYGSIIRCNIYSNRATGINFYSQVHYCIVENCCIASHGAGNGISAGYARANIKNTIFMGNGIGVRENDNRLEMALTNNLFFGNVIAVIEEASNNCYTAAEINSYDENTGNLTGNPGFSDLANNWNFNQFYTNSPCYDAGESGQDIGVFQDAPSVPVSSNTYYVAIGGNDARSLVEARNPLTPWGSVSNAAAHAIAGDTVHIGPGTYNGEVHVVHSSAEGKPVRYIADGQVVIEGGSFGIFLDRVNGVCFEGPFVIRGSSDYGLVLACAYSNSISDLQITNAGTYGVMVGQAPNNVISNLMIVESTHGVYVERSANCRVTDANISSNQTGVYVGEFCFDLYFDRCRLHNNRGYGVDESGYTSFSIFRNSNISSNGSHGMWVNTYGSPTCINCDIVDNGSYGINGRPVFRNIYLVNTIIAGNAGYGTSEGDTRGDVMATNCCYYNNGSGNYYDIDTASALNTAVEINALPECTANIVDDPLFKKKPAYEYVLKPESPCVDAGTEVSLDIDLYGNQRPTGAAPDIGSYELPPPGTCIVFF